MTHLHPAAIVAAVPTTRAGLSRRLTIALAALALLGGGIAAPAARAQQGNVVLRQFSGVPSGACSNVQLSVNVLTGDLYDCLGGAWNLITGGLGGPLLFSALQTGTNLTATMTVGTGSTLTFSGTGINNASKIQNVAITGTPTLGQIPIASSGTAASWGDPLVTPNFADNSAFTAGTTGVMNIGAWYSASPTACTTGNACAPSLTIDRKLFTQAFQGTSPWVVSLASTTITGTVGVTQSTSPWVVSGTVTTTPPSNASTNIAQWAGSTLGAMANYGASPGAVLVPGVNAFITNTPAVTLASTTITGTVAVTQSTSPWADNITQFGGTNLSTGTGAGGAGIPRVTLSNDSSLAANQSVNVAQIAGAATSTAASGVQKVGIVGNAGAAVDAANNAAAPANVLVQGVETIAQGSQPTAATAGNVRRSLATTEGAMFVQEGSSNRFSCFVPSTATITTQCQAAPAAGLRAYVTSAVLVNAVTTAQSLDIVFGTGTNCATGITALTAKWFWIGATETGNLSANASFTTPLIPTAANAICVRPTAATAFGATITGYIAP